jgi:exosome complex component RRP41
MGILPNSGELVFLQMDGDLSPEQFQEAWDYNMNAAMEIHVMMKEAIAKKYGGES